MIAGTRLLPASGHIIIIAVFTLLIGLSGLLTVPPIDRDESRFIQATTQMLETGDYVNIRFQDEARNKKPVGIYWLQAASVSVLADVRDRPLWAFRVPSLLGAAIATVATYVAGCALFTRRAAFAGAMLLAAAPVVLGEASIAKTDAAQLGAISSALAALAWILTKPGRPSLRLTCAFWFALGAAVLIKGPVGLMVAAFVVFGTTLLTKDRPRDLWARLRPGLGALILALVVAPWTLAIAIETDGRFFIDALGVDMLGKITSGQERHGGPPGYHLIAFLFMFWPATLFVFAAVPFVYSRRRQGGVLFCLSWLVPAWIVFEMTSTKLPHYPMVLYPAIALLIGHFVTAAPAERYGRLRRFGSVVYCLIGISATVGIVYLADRYSSAGLVIWHYLAGALVIIVTLMAGSLAWRGRADIALAAAAVASALFAWGAFEGVLPTLDKLLVTPHLAQMLDDNEAHPLRDDTGPVGLVSYHEPSAVFVLGTGTVMLEPEEGGAWLAAEPGRALVADRRDREGVFEGYAEAGGDGVPVPIARMEGYNYSNNTELELTLYRGGDE